MNKNIYTEEIMKIRNKKHDQLAFEKVRKYYSDYIRCRLNILVLACRAIDAGESIFNTEFVENNCDKLKEFDISEILRIVDSEITISMDRFILNNSHDIKYLPRIHKNNKKVLNAFIRECIQSGFRLKCEIVAILMEMSKSDKDIERGVAI